MSGAIIADETWIGGDPANRHQNAHTPVRVKNTAHNSKTYKQVVLSIIDARTGEVRSRIIPNGGGTTLRKSFGEHRSMLPGSVLFSE